MTVQAEIPFLDRLEFYGWLGVLKTVDPVTAELLDEVAEKKWREDTFDSPHEHAWFTSFHASQFPGDDIDACGRYLLYVMMNLPATGPMPPWVTMCGTLGKAGEEDIVWAWHHGGRLLSAPPDSEVQTGFEAPHAFMSGSTDMTVLRPFTTAPHVVEIKSKADEVIEQMITGQRKWDKAHRKQLLASLGLAHEYDWGKVWVCEETWRIPLVEEVDPGPFGSSGRQKVCRVHGDDSCLIEIELERPTTGAIYYWSRSWPRKTHEFFFRHNQDFMKAGLETLEKLKNNFLNDVLPPRPEHYQWSIGPCKDCRMKKHACKPDEGKKNDPSVTKLSESHGIEFAKTIRPDYDFDLVRAAVEQRWKNK